MDEIKQLLTVLLEQSDVTNATLDRIESRLASIESRLADLTGAVKGLHDKFDARTSR